VHSTFDPEGKRSLEKSGCRCGRKEKEKENG
jgi:hypothetical protein